MSIDDARKGRGRPWVGSTPLTVRLSPDELEQIDAWIEAQPGSKPTRPAAIRRLIGHAMESASASKGLHDRMDSWDDDVANLDGKARKGS
jgi:hypothetical protein